MVKRPGMLLFLLLPLVPMITLGLAAYYYRALSFGSWERNVSYSIFHAGIAGLFFWLLRQSSPEQIKKKRIYILMIIVAVALTTVFSTRAIQLITAIQATKSRS